MADSHQRLETFEELCRYVAVTLSRLETLQENRFPLSQQVLCRAGKPCGVYFSLHGPRALRLTAIWETDGNTILFYGSCGRRMHRTRLLASPPIESLSHA